jgi:hypothetical protein
MTSLIKNSLVILFLFLAFAGCIKGENPEPANEVVCLGV